MIITFCNSNNINNCNNNKNHNNNDKSIYTQRERWYHQQVEVAIVSDTVKSLCNNNDFNNNINVC